MNNYFTTYDSDITAALAAKGFPLDSIQKQEDGRVAFLFERSEHIDEAIQLYWSGNYLVDAKSLLIEVRKLKHLISQQKKK